MSKNSLTPNEKYEIGRAWSTGEKSTKELEVQYSVKGFLVRKYGRMVKNKKMIHSGTGRPRKIDPEFEKELIAEVDTNRISLRDNEFRDKVHEKLLKTNKKRNLSDSKNSSISRNCLKALEKNLGIQTNNAEVGTKARIEACEDIRNMVSFAAMSSYAHDLTDGDPNRICNSDGTTFTVGYNLKDVAKCKSFGKCDSRKSFKVKPQENIQSQGLFTIKMYFLIFGSGIHAPLIFIIENKQLPKDFQEVHKVPGLGLGATLDTNYAYVLFVQDRGLTTGFYVWFLQTVLFKICKSIREINSLPPNAKFFFKEDGEDIQIKCMKDPIIRQLLKENNIEVGKTSASITEIEQECDADNLFKAPKKKLSAIFNDDIIKNYNNLRILLENIWKSHQEATNTIITREHKKSGINGIIKIFHCLKSTININVIEKSFKVTGASPYNLNQIISQCTAKISREQEIIIKREIDYLKNVFASAGEIDENTFDLCGIDDNIKKKGKRKDELVVFRRRCILLSSDNFIAREEKKAQDKLDEIDRVEQIKINKANEKKRLQEVKDEIKRKKIEANAKRLLDNKRKAEEKRLKIASKKVKPIEYNS
jgi:hypothetical protein